MTDTVDVQRIPARQRSDKAKGVGAQAPLSAFSSRFARLRRARDVLVMRPIPSTLHEDPSERLKDGSVKRRGESGLPARTDHRVALLSAPAPLSCCSTHCTRSPPLPPPAVAQHGSHGRQAVPGGQEKACQGQGLCASPPLAPFFSPAPRPGYPSAAARRWMTGIGC